MWMSGIALLLVLVFVFLVAPYLVANLVTSRGTRPRDLSLTSTPADFGMSYEDVSFPATDGVPLKGWYMGGGRRGASIACAHGLFRSRREMLERSVFLRQAGFNVLVFDLRRHGASGGERTSLGFNERFDLMGAASFMKEKSPNDRMVLYGGSMGAVATLMAAAELAETGGVVTVVADSSFLSLESTVVHHVRLLLGFPRFPLANELLFFIERLAGFRRDELDLETAVARCGNLPILFVAGDKDRRIPVEDQERLHRAAKSPLSRFVVIEGATHGAAYRTSPEIYREALFEFLTEVLEPAN